MKHVERKLIEQLPKTDLHCHLDGSPRIETLIELAKKNKVSLPTYEPEVLMEKMKYGRVRNTLEEYLQGFEPIIAVMQDPEDIERVFYEVCEVASQENVWHLELRYCPSLLTRKGLTSKEVVQACNRAREMAEKDFGMSVVQILCGLKNDASSSIFEVAKLVTEFRDQGVVGFDLAGPEKGFPIRDHLQAIYWAKKHHVFITLHAGEACGPESIFEAIHDASAHRIGHGTSLIKDERIFNYVINHRIGVESCPISNWHTGSVRSLDEHPLKIFLDRGVRVSINTDNRLCSDTSITEEILAMIEHQDLTMAHVKKLLLNGFKSAFLPYDTKVKMIDAFNEKWDMLVKDTAVTARKTT